MLEILMIIVLALVELLILILLSLPVLLVDSRAKDQVLEFGHRPELSVKSLLNLVALFHSSSMQPSCQRAAIRLGAEIRSWDASDNHLERLERMAHPRLVTDRIVTQLRGAHIRKGSVDNELLEKWCAA